MRSRLGESDPPLYSAGQHSHERGPQASKNQETRGSAGDLWKEELGRRPRTRGSDSLRNQSASRQQA